MTSTKFNVGDPVKVGPTNPEIYFDTSVRIIYSVGHKNLVGFSGLREDELFELSTEEKAGLFKAKKAEELKKKMIAAIEEYDAFLKNESL